MMADANDGLWLRQWAEGGRRDVEKCEKKEEEDSDVDDAEEDGDSEMEGVEDSEMEVADEEDEFDEDVTNSLLESQESCDNTETSSSVRDKNHGSTKSSYRQQATSRQLGQGKLTCSSKQKQYREIVESAELAKEGQPYSCVFACKQCDFTTNSMTRLRHHMKKKVHGPSSCSKFEAVKFLKKAYSHVCKICHKKELHERHVTKMHSNSHELGFDTFREIYVQGDKLLEQKVLQTKAKFLIRSKYLEMLAGAEISKNTDDNCSTFSCRKCEHKTRTIMRLRQHFRMTNHGPGDFTRYDIVNYTQKAVCHICKLCSERVLCERIRLFLHMDKKHSTSLIDYNIKFGIATNVLGKEVKTLSLPKMKRILNTAETSDDIISSCTYKCQQCDYQIKSIFLLKKHFVATLHGPHRISIYGYIDFVDKVVTHRCRICSEILLCDYKYIQNHLRFKHNLKTAIYRTKYLGLKIGPSKQEIDEGKLLLEKALQSAEVSEEATSLCRFSCPQCNYTATYPHALKPHFETSKHGKTTISLKDMVTYMTKSVCHVCKICSEKVLCEKQQLGSHFRNVHKISMAKYRDLFRKKPLDGQDGKNVNEAEITDAVGSLCRFNCSKCQRQFNSVSGLQKHVTGCLGIPVLPRDEAFEKFITHKVIHKCQLCYKQLLCDSTVFNTHFRYNHKISTLKEYCQKTGCKLIKWNHFAMGEREELCSDVLGNLCNFQCPKCKSNHLNWDNLMRHLRASGHGDRKGKSHEWKQFITKSVWYKCKLCGEKILCDSAFIHNHVGGTHKIGIDKYRSLAGLKTRNEVVELYDKTLKALTASVPKCDPQRNSIRNFVDFNGQATVNVANLCKYECKMCKHAMDSWCGLDSHMRKKHGTKASYEMLTRRVYHKCFKCSKVMLCDFQLIGIHVRRTHNMILSDYGNLVSRNGGKFLPTLQEFVRQQLSDNSTNQNKRRSQKKRLLKV